MGKTRVISGGEREVREGDIHTMVSNPATAVITCLNAVITCLSGKPVDYKWRPAYKCHLSG